MKTQGSRVTYAPRIVGWREWVALPDLGVSAVKAKLDTGAKTSALHVWDQELLDAGAETIVRFNVHPFQHDSETAVRCEARLSDRRWVTNSGGTREERNVILTTLGVGDERWTIELTLASRDDMGFRMLIGREAMRGRLVIDPKRSYRTGMNQDPRLRASGSMKGDAS